MLFTSPVYSQASGSIAGITYSHNRSGMYTRARTTPTDPATTLQDMRRSHFALVVNQWSTVATLLQREAWEQYAASMPRTNPLGQTVYLTGQQMFIRCNTYRLLVGAPILFAAPMPNAMAELTPAAEPTPDASANNVSVPFFNSDPWAATAGGFLLAFLGRPRNQSRNFYKGPYRFLGWVDGDTITPPTPPAVLSSVGVWNLTGNAGQKVNVKLIALNADGTVSAPLVFMPIIQP